MKRRVHLVAVCLAAVAVAESVLAVSALGHRHGPSHSDPMACHEASSCSGGHHHPVAPREAGEPTAPADSSESPDPACSICRHLVQVALPCSLPDEPLSQELFGVVSQLAEFDVAIPSYLLPEPRSPPVGA